MDNKMNENNLLGAAFQLAFQAHAGQFDKSGAAYIAHVVRVAARLETEDQQIVGLLHDVVEDTETGLEAVRSHFGEDIAQAVDAITKRDGEPKDAYLARVRANPLAHAVKLADLADNSDPVRLSLLPPDIRERLVRKYAHAKSVLGEVPTC